MLQEELRPKDPRERKQMYDPTIYKVEKARRDGEMPPALEYCRNCKGLQDLGVFFCVWAFCS